MSSTSESLRERLKAETEAQMGEIVEDAAQRIVSRSEARIREAVAQATADLAHQAERMERVARRLTWLRAATVGLAMAAGAMGGIVFLLILQWIT
jgi:hypothetical protein